MVVLLSRKATYIFLVLIIAVMCGCDLENDSTCEIQTNVCPLEFAVKGAPIPCGPQTFTEKDSNRDYYGWLLRTTVQPFKEKSDMSDPDNMAVVAFLEDYCRWQALQKPHRYSIKLEEQGKSLIERGSTEPLVLGLYGRALRSNDKKDEAELYMRRARKSLHDELVVPRFFTSLNLLSTIRNKREMKEDEIKQLNDEVIELLARAIRNGEITREESRIAYLLANSMPINDGYKWKKIKQLLEGDESVDPWFLSMCAGKNAIEIAWIYRGTDYAYTVTPENREKFHSYLKEADKHLTKAWEIRPQYPEAAGNMITVIMGGGSRYSDTERFWFDRAVEAQMDYTWAYKRLLNSMLPRWGGSHEMMEAFGIECLETGRFDTDVPVFYLYALKEIANDTPNNRWREVFRRPVVFENLDRLFNGMLQDPSRADQKDAILAQKALCRLWAGNYSEAQDMLASIEPKPDVEIGLCHNALTWKSRSWDIVDAEIRLFTGPHKETLQKAESLLASYEIEGALSLFKSVLPAYQNDGPARSYLLRRMALMHTKWEYEGWEYSPLHFAAIENLVDFAGYLISVGEPVDPVTDSDATPLLFACQRNKLDMVRFLIANNANINTTDNIWNSALHYACQHGNLDMVRLLLEKNANINKTNKSGIRATHYACKQGNLDIISLLLANNADINATDNNGNSPLHYASDQGKLDIISLLLANNADINATDKNTNSPLHYACKQGHLDIVSLLLANSADINATNKDGNSALHYACKQGHLDIVSLLLANNADINTTNEDGNSALYYAVDLRHNEIAELLIQRGANADTINMSRWSPLHTALFYGQSSIAEKIIDAGANINTLNGSGWSPLLLALRYASENVGKRLIEMGSEINIVSDEQWTPLHLALFYDKPELAKMLIEKGSDVNALNNQLFSPLHLALFKTQPEIAIMLIERGSDINASGYNGQRPIHFAIEQNLTEAARELIVKGCDVNSRNKDGLTPLHLAIVIQNEQIVKLLLKKGADPQATSTNGKTPIDYARDTKNERIIDMF